LKALVLDVGGPVLITPFERLPAIEERLGVPRGTLDWTGPFDPTRDPLWQAMQADEITERDYWNRRCAEILAYGEDLSDLHGVMKLIYSGVEAELVRPQWRPLIRDAAAAGIRVVALTNDLELFHGDSWVDMMPILTEIDAVVDASWRDFRKPDAAAYHAALDAAEVDAEEALMVDDQPGNVVGARALGMNTVLFDVTGIDASFAEIRAMLDLD
jgi:putative hydrolase of the HAD superfamily